MAIAMYEGMGYCVYRTVAGYYAGGVKEGEEDAYGEFRFASRYSANIGVHS